MGAYLVMQAALSWAEEDAEPSNGGLRVVLLRNLFEPGELDGAFRQSGQPWC